MGEADDAAGCGYICMMTVLRVAAGVCGILFISYFAAATIPLSVLMGVQLANYKYGGESVGG